VSSKGTIDYMKWREKAIAMPPGRARREVERGSYRKNYDRIFTTKKEKCVKA